MTSEQEKELQELFTKYGHPSTESDERIYIYLTHPDAINRLTEVIRYDERAIDYIADLERKIEQLNAYRLSLSERYNYLASAPQQPVVRLKRVKSYSGKVFYHLNTYTKNLLDGNEVETSSTHYTGTERSKAISDYKSYVKSHPGITAEMQIEKPKWER